MCVDTANCNGHCSECVEDMIQRRVSAERAKMEDEFQARLGPWVDAVRSLIERGNVMEQKLDKHGLGAYNWCQLTQLVRDRLLSSPDAITAQAREEDNK